MVKDYFKILFKETTVFVCIVIEIGFTMWLRSRLSTAPWVPAQT